VGALIEINAGHNTRPSLEFDMMQPLMRPLAQQVSFD
jgi:hypothetical protein